MILNNEHNKTNEGEDLHNFVNFLPHLRVYITIKYGKSQVLSLGLQRCIKY